MRSLPFALITSLLACPLAAQETSLFWGDTHLHSSSSTDAYDRGFSVTVEDAYRFARGLPIIQPATKQRIRIDRPLDFLVVADHAELMGISPRLAAKDSEVLATSAGQRLKAMFDENPDQVFAAQLAISFGNNNQDVLDQLYVPEIIRGAWDKQISAAERNNKPGEFTAFIGWEWSSTTSEVNQHRVVFTRDNGDVARRFLPLSSYDTDRPEELWQWLEKTENQTGAHLLAIPHNSNLSKGLMFPDSDSMGNAMTLADAEARRRWEPVMEVTQYKGTSETHPVLAPTDEFAAFELRERLFNGDPVTPYAGSFARTALKTGLEIESRLGVNPYKFGMIGASDSHTGLVSVTENNFMGKSALDTVPEQRPSMPLGLMSAWEVSASGLAGVWARENTREAIFDAFMRKEVFATSGPRISLRVFGSFNFRRVNLERDDIPTIGYRRGIPMGGDLTAAPKGRAPSLLIEALSDAKSGTLDRVQVIKGWQDVDGSLQEKIFDVVWAGDRRLDSDGNLPGIINTVDTTTASYDNSTGEPRLATLWQDPEFDPDLKAFYYVRVLEIPTPRHHVYDAVALGLAPEAAYPGKPTAIQERAWSSPIWYTP